MEKETGKDKSVLQLSKDGRFGPITNSYGGARWEGVLLYVTVYRHHYPILNIPH